MPHAGTFRTDLDRRTLGHIAPGRDTLALISAATKKDPYSDTAAGFEGESETEAAEILAWLEDEGLADVKNGVWTITDKGYDALQN